MKECEKKSKQGMGIFASTDSHSLIFSLLFLYLDSKIENVLSIWNFKQMIAKLILDSSDFQNVDFFHGIY